MHALLTRDFALPILCTLIDARERNMSISELVDSLPKRRTATDRLTDIPTERSRTLVSELLEGDVSVLPPELGSPDDIETTDGARMTFPTGEIVTIRPSGNAPELRAYVEADNIARAEGLLRDVLMLLEQRLS
jgi:phosphomannomutase